VTSTWQIVLTVFLVLEWVIRFVMVFVVPKDRRPSSATAWLLLIMITPTIGSILFAMFGNPKLPKSRRLKQQKVDKLTIKELEGIVESNPALLPELDDDHFDGIAKLSTYLGGLPVMDGNDVEFIESYDEAFKKITATILAAKEYVHLEYFILVLDDSTKSLFEALKRAQRRGVKVRILYDGLVSRRYPGHKKMRAFLKEAGIEVHQMLPLHLLPGKHFSRPDLRNHRKIVVVDGQTAYIGSQNIVDKYYHRKDGMYYEELVVKLKGPVVWQCNNVFRADWFAETNDPLRELVEDHDLPQSAGRVKAQLLPSGPSHEHDNNLKLYTSIVHAAKKRVGIVVPYFIPDESFLTAVLAAAQRGVEVTIINSESIDKLLAGHAQRSYYNELLQAGVRVFLYETPAFLHTKQLIVDDKVAVVGSSNLDIRSFELDLEVGIILYDNKVVNKLRDIEDRYLSRSRRVTKKIWAQRRLHHRMLDSLARLTAALQ
jgi:cardiolipin synthase A/B